MIGLVACGESRVKAQDEDLQAMKTTANDFQNRVHVRGIPDAHSFPRLDSHRHHICSFYSNRTVTEARFKELLPAGPGQFQSLCKLHVGSGSGETLFRNSFYRFFFVHELGHWLQDDGAGSTGRGEETWPGG
jgi:hypothetical protein